MVSLAFMDHIGVVGLSYRHASVEDVARFAIPKADIEARLPIEEFEARFGRFLTDDERAADIDTVGGLIVTIAGRVPARGEVIAHPSGREFRILEVDARRIRRMRTRQPIGLPA